MPIAQWHKNLSKADYYIIGAKAKILYPRKVKASVPVTHVGGAHTLFPLFFNYRIANQLVNQVAFFYSSFPLLKLIIVLSIDVWIIRQRSVAMRMLQAYVSLYPSFIFLFSLMGLGIEFLVFKGFILYLLTLLGWCFVYVDCVLLLSI